MGYLIYRAISDTSVLRVWASASPARANQRERRCSQHLMPSCNASGREGGESLSRSSFCLDTIRILSPYPVTPPP